MSIRIGIAGFGKHALRRILPALEADGRFRLAGVWSRSPATQEALRARGVAAVTADFEAFLSWDMDVVYVASPTGLHAEHAAAVLAAGRHAWVEKPLAVTPEDAQRLLALAEARGLMLAEAFMFPWHDQAAQLRHALDEEVIGKLRSASLTFCFPHLPADDFRYRPELGGGAFLDHGCYLVKALDSCLGGEWSVLGGCSSNDGRDVDVRGAALLRRASDGVSASLHWGFGCSYVNEIALVGERGRLLVESAFTKPDSRSCDVIVEDASGARSVRAVRREDPYRRMIAGFADALARPERWPALRAEIGRQAQLFFALGARLAHD